MGYMMLVLTCSVVLLTTFNIYKNRRARSEPGGTRWRTGGEVKEKLSNGVGSQYSHATSESAISRITQADAHTSAASSRLNWRPHGFKWTSPFRGRRNLVSARVPSRSARALLPLVWYIPHNNRISKGKKWSVTWATHAPAALPPACDPEPTVQEAGWAPGPVWTGAENLACTGFRSPDRPARSESLYRLRFVKYQ